MDDRGICGRIASRGQTFFWFLAAQSAIVSLPYWPALGADSRTAYEHCRTSDLKPSLWRPGHSFRLSFTENDIIETQNSAHAASTRFHNSFRQHNLCDCKYSKEGSFGLKKIDFTTVAKPLGAHSPALAVPPSRIRSAILLGSITGQTEIHHVDTSKD